MNDTEDRIGPHEVPRVHRGAAAGGIARQTIGVDRIDATVAAGGSAVQLTLVDVDAFLVLGRGAAGSAAARTRTACETVSRRLRRRIQRTIVGDVIECADRARGT